MHQAGKDIVNEGFPHIVSITNEVVNGTFRNHAKKFIDSCVKKHSGVYLWNGHPCKIAIQDGELSGYGVFAFFQTQEGKTAALHRSPPWFKSVNLFD